MESSSNNLDVWDDLDFDDDDDSLPPVGGRGFGVATSFGDSDSDDSPEWPSSPTMAVVAPAVHSVNHPPTLPGSVPGLRSQPSSEPTVADKAPLTDSLSSRLTQLPSALLNAQPAYQTSTPPPAAGVMPCAEPLPPKVDCLLGLGPGLSALPGDDPVLQAVHTLPGRREQGELWASDPKAAAPLPSGSLVAPGPPLNTMYYDGELAEREVSFSSIAGPSGAAAPTADSAGGITEVVELSLSPRDAAAAKEKNWCMDFQALQISASRKVEEAAWMRLPPGAAAAAGSVAVNKSDLHDCHGDGAGGGNERDFFSLSTGVVLQTSGGQMLSPAAPHSSALKTPPWSSHSPLGPMSLSSPAERANPGPLPPAGFDIAAVAPPPPPPPQLSCADSGALSRTASRRHRLSVSTSFRECETDPTGAIVTDLRASLGLELQTGGLEEDAPSAWLNAAAASQPLVQADRATSGASDIDGGVAVGLAGQAASQILAATTSQLVAPSQPLPPPGATTSPAARGGNTVSEDYSLPLRPSADPIAWSIAAALPAVAGSAVAAAGQATASVIMHIPSEELPSSRGIAEEVLVTEMPTSSSFDATTDSLLDTAFAQSAGGAGGMAGSALRARPGVSHLYRTSIASSATATPSELAAFDDAFDELMADSNTEPEPHAPSPPRPERLPPEGSSTSGSAPLMNGFVIAAQKPFGPSDSLKLAEEDAEDIFSAIAAAAPVTPAEASMTQQQQQPLQYNFAAGSRPNLPRLFSMPSGAGDAAAEGSAGGAVASHPSGLTQFRQASRPLFDSAAPSPRAIAPLKEAAVGGMAPSAPGVSSVITPAPVTIYQEVAAGVSTLFGGDGGDEDGDVFGSSVGPLGIDTVIATVAPLAATVAGTQQQQQQQQELDLHQVPGASAGAGAPGQAGWPPREPHWQQHLAPTMQQQQQQQWRFDGRMQDAGAVTDEGSSFFDSLAAESIAAPVETGHVAYTAMTAGGATSSTPVGNESNHIVQYVAAHGASAAIASSVAVGSPLPHGSGADDASSFFDSLDELQQAAHPDSVSLASGQLHGLQGKMERAAPAANPAATAMPWQESQQGQQYEDQKPQSQSQGQLERQLHPPGAAQVAQQPRQSGHGGVTQQALPLPLPLPALGLAPSLDMGYGYAETKAQDDGMSFFDTSGSQSEAEATVPFGTEVVSETPADIATQVITSWEAHPVVPLQHELENLQGQVALPPPRQQQQQEQQMRRIEQSVPVAMMQQQSFFGQKSMVVATPGGFDGSNFFDNLPDSPRADEGIEGSKQHQQESAVLSGAATPLGVATVPARHEEVSGPGTAPYDQWTAQQQQGNVHLQHNQRQPYSQQGYGAHDQQNFGQQQMDMSQQAASPWQVAQQQPTYGQTYSNYHGQPYGQPAEDVQMAVQKTQGPQTPADVPYSQIQTLPDPFVRTSVTGSATQAAIVLAASATPVAVVAAGDGDEIVAPGATASNQAGSVFADGNTQARVQYEIAASPGLPSPPWTHPDGTSNAPAMHHVPGHSRGQAHEADVPLGRCDDPQAPPQGQTQATWQGQQQGHRQGQDGDAAMQLHQGEQNVWPAAAGAVDESSLANGGRPHGADQQQQGRQVGAQGPTSEHEQEQQEDRQVIAAAVEGAEIGGGDGSGKAPADAALPQPVAMSEEQLQAAAVAAATAAWEGAGGYSLPNSSETYQQYYAYYYYYYKQQQQEYQHQKGPCHAGETQKQAEQQPASRLQQEQALATTPDSVAIRSEAPVAEEWGTVSGQAQHQNSHVEGTSAPRLSQTGMQGSHQQEQPNQQHHHPDNHQLQHTQQHQHHHHGHVHAHHHLTYNHQQQQAQYQLPAQESNAQPQQHHASAWSAYTTGAPVHNAQQQVQQHLYPQSAPGSEPSPEKSQWAQYQPQQLQQPAAFDQQGAYGHPNGTSQHIHASPYGGTVVTGVAPYGQHLGYGVSNHQQYGSLYGAQSAHGGYGHQEPFPGMYGQHQHGMQHAQVNYLPTTPDLARTCPHGRPSHVVFAFGFGGRIVLMRPPTSAKDTDTMAVFGNPGPLQLVPLAGLTQAHLAGASRTSTAGTYAVSAKSDKKGNRGAQANSSVPVLEPLVRQITAFPGPLGPSTSKDKVMKWLSDHVAVYSAEDAAKAPSHAAAVSASEDAAGPAASLAPAAAQTRLLWEVLRLMVKYSEAGKAKQAWGWLAGQAKDDQSMDSELVKLLLKQRPSAHPPHPKQGQQSSHAGGLAAAAGGLFQSAAAAAVAAAAVAAGGTPNSGVGNNPSTVGTDSADSSPGPDDGDDEMLEGNHAVGGPSVLAASAPEALQQAAAKRMQRLLVLGRKIDALKVATEAGLWGPALLLATAVSPDGRAFQEAAVAMAQSLLLPGAPVRTLALVLAGRPDLVHAMPDSAADTASHSVAAAPSTTGVVSSVGPSPPPFGPAVAPASSQPGPQMPPAGFYNPMATVATAAAGRSGGGASAVVGADTGGCDGANVASGGMLASWREHLVVLLTTRGPVDSTEAVVRLGDRLRTEASQVAAHICYCLSSCPPTLPDAVDFRYSLVGATTAAAAQHPLADGGLALQRTEVLEWLLLRQAAAAAGGGGAAAGGVAAVAPAAGTTAEAAQLQMWALLPFKLLHAWQLVEYGKIPEALQYCAAIEAVLRTGGIQMAPGHPPQQQQQQQHLAGRFHGGAWLHMTEVQLRRLQDRLMHFAQANSINLHHHRSESTITKVGRFLDGTINKLFWGWEQGDGGASAGGGGVAPGTDGTAGGADNTTAARPTGPQVVMGGPSVEPTDLGPVSPWLPDHQQNQQGHVGPGMQPGTGSVGGRMQHSASMVALAAAADGGITGMNYGRTTIDGAAAAAGAVMPPLPPPRTSFTGAMAPPAYRSVPTSTLPAYGYEPVMGAGFAAGGNMGESAAVGLCDSGNPAGAERAPLPARQQTLGHRRIVSALDLPPHDIGQLLQPPGTVGDAPSSMPTSSSGAPPLGSATTASGASQGEARSGDKGGTPKGGDTKRHGSPPSRSKNSARWLVNPLRLLGGRKGGASGTDGDGPKKGNFGEENKYYYDETRKRWVMRGHEDAVAEEEKPTAPPTTLGGGWTAAAAMGSAPPAVQGAPNSPHATATSPSENAVGVPGGVGGLASATSSPTIEVPSQFFQRGKGIHSRYVNTFTSGTGGGTGTGGGGGGTGGGDLKNSASYAMLHSATASPPSFLVPPPPPRLQPGEAAMYAPADTNADGQVQGTAPTQLSQQEGDRQQHQQSSQQPWHPLQPAPQIQQPQQSQPLLLHNRLQTQHQELAGQGEHQAGASAPWTPAPPPQSAVPLASTQQRMVLQPHPPASQPSQWPLSTAPQQLQPQLQVQSYQQPSAPESWRQLQELQREQQHHQQQQPSPLWFNTPLPANEPEPSTQPAPQARLQPLPQQPLPTNPTQQPQVPQRDYPFGTPQALQMLPVAPATQRGPWHDQTLPMKHSQLPLPVPQEGQQVAQEVDKDPQVALFQYRQQHTTGQADSPQFSHIPPLQPPPGPPVQPLSAQPHMQIAPDPPYGQQQQPQNVHSHLLQPGVWHTNDPQSAVPQQHYQHQLSQQPPSWRPPALVDTQGELPDAGPSAVITTTQPPQQQVHGTGAGAGASPPPHSSLLYGAAQDMTQMQMQAGQTRVQAEEQRYGEQQQQQRMSTVQAPPGTTCIPDVIGRSLPYSENSPSQMPAFRAPSPTGITGTQQHTHQPPGNVSSRRGIPQAQQQAPVSHAAAGGVVDDLLGYGSVGMYDHDSGSMGPMGYSSMSSYARPSAAMYEYASLGSGAPVYNPYAAPNPYGSAYYNTYGAGYNNGDATGAVAGPSTGDGEMREVEL
ncbi:hypothetical protein VaNZ11_002907 [Volvox africanus]|uniref:Protein transport protein sec16 n=1 Tax=Volvox africanus TaxID=51714 RepID=A0ABQ5RUT7_9CHLO|nr:hypothetical protein VaNZ11_002907 [Volvox africanus]